MSEKCSLLLDLQVDGAAMMRLLRKLTILPILQLDGFLRREHTSNQFAQGFAGTPSFSRPAREQKRFQSQSSTTSHRFEGRVSYHAT